MTPADWIEKHFYIPETLADPDLKGRIPLQQYQRDVLNEALGVDENGNFKYSVVVWSDIKKSAKALSLDTIIPTPDGYTTMGDIQVGDMVYDIDGNETVVEATTGVMYDHQCYRITFSSGEEVIADAGHLWYVRDRRSKNKDGGNRWGEVLVKTTEEMSRRFILQDYINKDGYRVICRRFTLPATSGIKGKEKNLLIHPYILGYWLGDGHSSAATITTADQEVIEHIKKLGYPVNKHKAKYAWGLTDGTRGGGPKRKEKTVGGKLRKLGVLNNKHIPIQYLRASREQRLELLRGLMDADGTVSEKGKCSFCSTSDKLAFGVSELLSSLGIKSNVRITDAKLNGRFISKLYRISFQAYTDMPVFHIQRKKEKIIERKKKVTRSDRNTITNIEQIESVPVKCIQVKGNSYLITTGFLPTHNSTIAGAVGLWMADTRPWVEGYFIANDIKQADSRSAKYARRAVMLSPYLRENFTNNKYKILHKYNGSFIEAIPVDPEGEAGANPDFLMWSEMWGTTDDAKARMWSESTLSPTKFGKSFRWIETYAGFTDESETLYDLWDMGVKRGDLLWPDRLYPVTGGPDGEIVDHAPLELYVNREARLLCMWNTVPRCPWQTQEYYSSEESVLHPLEFLRMHRNQWVANTETYIPMEWWAACARDEIPEIPKNHSFVICLDAAVTADCFGMNMVCRHPDKTNYPDDSILFKEWEWKPSDYGGKIDYIGTIEKPGPETVLRSFIMDKDKFKEWYLGYFKTWQADNPRHNAILNELLENSDYNIVEVAYDPHQLHDMANRLGNKEQLAWFRPFPQGSGKHSRQISDSDLRDKIRMRRIWYKNKPLTTDHLQNADAKIDSEERRVRIIKRTEKLKVDLAVALSMADYEVFRLNL